MVEPESPGLGIEAVLLGEGGLDEVERQLLDALPGRDAIKGALTRVWNQERQTVPVRRGGRLFFRRNSGLQNQSVLMVQDGASGTPRTRK